LKKGVFCFQLNGKEVLGFDTGLNPRDFARAKIGESIFQPGCIIYPDGRTDAWQIGGVTPINRESSETMVVWGPLFPGESLTELIRSENKDEALDAVRFWLKARIVLEDKNSGHAETAINGAGSFIIARNNDSFPLGTVFFPPAIFYERSLEAGEERTSLDNERYKHPDLDKYQGISFCAGAMLYRIFCGVDAFIDDNKDDLRRNIREAVFLPPNLALPALDPEMSGIIGRSLGKASGGELFKRPNPKEIVDFIGPPGSRHAASWLRTLDEKEIIKINNEKARYEKKTALTVKTKRFVTRNKIIIAASLLALIFVIFFVADIFRSRSRDSIKGLSPIEVANVYYNAFGELDHTLMEKCVAGKAGKEDIEMVINFTVISRVRQAYEFNSGSFISAQEWIDAGRPPVEKIIFGVTDLKLSAFSMNGENARLTAEYMLWRPNYSDEGNSAIPEGDACIDDLDFAFRKGIWAIVSIKRELQPVRNP
jgi:hypothetical protein